MIEAREMSRFRKALNRLMKRPYSHDEAVDIIARMFLLPRADGPLGGPFALEERRDAFMAKYGDTMHTSVESLAVALVASRVGRMDDNEPMEPYMSYPLAQLACMCYGEHVVEMQRKRIERKGYQLSDDGASHLFERERRRCEEQYGLPENLRPSEAVADVVGASAGRIPSPPSSDPWNMF